MAKLRIHDAPWWPWGPSRPPDLEVPEDHSSLTARVGLQSYSEEGTEGEAASQHAAAPALCFYSTPTLLSYQSQSR